MTDTTMEDAFKDFVASSKKMTREKLLELLKAKCEAEQLYQSMGMQNMATKHEDRLHQDVDRQISLHRSTLANKDYQTALDQFIAEGGTL